MKFNVALDDRSVKQLAYINGFMPHWIEHLYHDMADYLAKATVDKIKPYTRAKRSVSTGESEQSVRSDPKVNSDGFDVDFFGNLGAFYMDEGNFSPDETLWAPVGNVKQAFPVDARFGAPFFTPYIHGMGHLTSGVPTHYSEKVADWIVEEGAAEAYLESMQKWFDSVVIGA